MTDLENLAACCHVKAADDQEPAVERRLWEQIAGEIETYMADPDDTAAQVGLFEATS